MGAFRSIKNYEALKLPDDIEVLKISILDVVQMLREEAPLYLMQAFDITKTQAVILYQIGSHKEISRERIGQILKSQGYIGEDVASDVLKVQMSKLNKNLALHKMTLSRNKLNKTLFLDGEKGKFAESLLPFRANSWQVCRLLGVNSLKISKEDLHGDKENLQEALDYLLKMIRSDPLQESILNLGLSVQQSVLMGVYQASVLEGVNYAFKKRFLKAIYPCWIENDAFQEECLGVQLAKIHRAFGCHSIIHYKNGLTAIPKEIAEALRPPASVGARAGDGFLVPMYN